MRVFTSFILSFLVTLVVPGCNPGSRPSDDSSGVESPEMTTNMPSMRVVVTNGKITIDDHTIELPCPVETITNLFGDPARTLSLANVIHVWDKTGVFAYLSPDQQSVDTLAFAFDRFDADHWPKNYFNGYLSIDDQLFSKSTTNADLTAARYDNYGIILWFRQTGGVGVDVHTNDTNVVSVSLAPES